MRFDRVLKQTDFLLQRPSIHPLHPFKAGALDCLEPIIMRQYLGFHEKILLLIYYCFHLAFQVFKVRGLAMPSSTRPSVQKPEHSQSFDVSFLSGQLDHPFLITVDVSEASELP